MAFSDRGPQDRDKGVEEALQKIDQNKVVEYESGSEMIQGEFGISVPQERDDQVVDEMQKNLASIKESYNGNRSPFMYGIQDFIDKVDVFSLEDVKDSFVSLGEYIKNLGDREPTDTQVTFSLISALPRYASDVVGGLQKSQENNIGQVNKELRGAIDGIDLRRLSPEKQRDIDEKLLNIKRRLPIGGVEGITKDQLALCILLYENKDLMESDVFGSEESKVLIQQGLSQSYVKQLVQSVSIFEEVGDESDRMVGVAVGAKFMSARVVQSPEGARSIAENIDTSEPGDVKKTNNSLVANATKNMSQLYDVDFVSVEPPAMYDRSAAIDIVKKYNIPPEKEETYMMGLMLYQRSENTGNDLAPDQQVVVDGVLDYMQSHTQSIIEGRLVNEAEALYVSWMGKMMGDVHISTPVYKNGSLETEYQVPGCSDILRCVFGGSIVVTDYASYGQKDDTDDYSPFSQKEFTVGLPAMDSMVKDVLEQVNKGDVAMKSFADIEGVCDDMIRQTNKKYPAKEAHEMFQSHTANVGAKLALRDMVSLWNHGYEVSHEQVPVEIHKHIASIVDPALCVLSLEEKGRFSDDCRKRSSRSQGLHPITKNPHLKQSEDTLVQSALSGDIMEVVDLFTVSRDGAKPLMDIKMFTQFTEYIDGIREEAIDPQQTFLGYIGSRGRVVHRSLREKWEIYDSEKNTPIIDF